MKIFDPKLTGSIEILNTISGNVTIAGGLTVEGSLGGSATTASYVEYSDVVNKPTLVSSSAQIASDISGSFTEVSSSLEQRVSANEGSVTSLNSASSSYLLNTTDTLVGDLTVTGTITAQEFHTEFVSASIIYQSGSTQFGNSSDDTHIFTGNLSVDGTSTINDTISGNFSNYNTKFLVGGDIVARSLTANESLIAIGGDANGAYIKTGKQDASLTDRSLNIITGEDIRVTVDTSGNVGIGTSIPSTYSGTAGTRVLAVGSTTGNNGVNVISGTTSTGTYTFSDSGGNDRGGLVYYHTADLMTILTGGSEKIRILNTGYVGIGETTPLVPLHISRNTASGENIALILDNNDSTANSEIAMVFRSYVGSTNTDYQIATVNTAGNQAQLVFRSDGGTERMRITHDGNVGIGVAPYTNNLSNSKGIDILGGGGLFGYNNSSYITANTHYNSDWTYKTTNPAGVLLVADILTFRNAASGTGGTTIGNFTERFRIATDGNVGIGTTVPTSLLHLRGTAPNIFFDDTSTTGTRTRFQIIVGDVGTTQSALLGFNNTSGTSLLDVLTVNENGRVGIGITAPTTDLHVASTNSQVVRVTTSGALSSGYYDAFQLLAGNQTGGGLSLNIGKAESTRNLGKIVYFHTSDGSTSNRLGFGFYDADSLFNILANGNVGIGTTSPTAVLQLRPPSTASTISTLGTSVSSAINVTIPNAVGDVGQIIFSNQAAPSYGYGSIGMVMTSGTGVGLGDFVIATKSIGTDAVSTERMRITSGGDTELVKTGIENISSSTSAILKFRNTQTNSQSQIGGTINTTSRADWGGDLVFSTKPANGTPNDSVTERVRILADGGLTFNGDTAAANALDDYEEGTWTPVIKGSSTLGSYTLSGVYAKYVKIGSLVYINAGFTVTVNSAGAGYLVIGGAPFGKGLGLHAGNVETRGFNHTDGITQLTLLFTSTSAGVTDLYFSALRDNTSTIDEPISGLTTGNSIHMSMTYSTH